MRRALIWSLALPFAAVSILAGHAAAYALTGAPAGTVHGYLGHAPQIAAVLVLLGLIGLARDARAREASALPVAALAAVGFTCQEHLESVLHSGELPFLLSSSTFWVGLVLQIPFAAVVWLAGRLLARSLAGAVLSHPPRLALLPVVRPAVSRAVPVSAATGAVPGRGPPLPA